MRYYREAAAISYDNAAKWSRGGPVAFDNEAAVLIGFLTTDLRQTMPGENFLIFEDASVLGPSDPLSNLVAARNGLKRYKVRRGDTLSSIAASFGITVETIRWANLGLRSQLKTGQELIILPVTGILYEVKENDTLESIAALYKIDPESIKEYNPDYQKIFGKNSGVLILPYAEPIRRIASTYASGLPDLGNYFKLPVIGWNWGELHEYNAVDIANQCGTPVYASAEGLVVPDDTLGDGTSGWNNGYGIFVLIEHPNGTKTRYSHLQKTLVKLGDFVSQGQEIGLLGNTGNTHGPTGCHLHFEVIGAKNPFAIR